MTIVLGLDLGSKGGFARYDTESGGLLLGLNRWDLLSVPDRVVAFGEWLDGILGGNIWQIEKVEGKAKEWVVREIAQDWSPVDVVGFEQVTFSGHGRGSEFITRQEGVVQYLARDVSWQGINVSTLKKWATGDGHAQKPTMVAAARYGIRTLGHEPPDKLSEDEADAFLVLAWMLVNALPGWSMGGS